MKAAPKVVLKVDSRAWLMVDWKGMKRAAQKAERSE